MSQTNGDSKKMDVTINVMSWKDENERRVNEISYGAGKTKNIFPDNLEIIAEDDILLFDEKNDKIHVKTGTTTKVINVPMLMEKRKNNKLHKNISVRLDKMNKKDNGERVVG